MINLSGDATGLFAAPSLPGQLLRLERANDVFSTDIQVTKDDLKREVVKDMKTKDLAGAAETDLEISLDSSEGDDILIKKLDPENALGYRTFDSEDEYFQQVDADLYQPSAKELGLDG